MDRTGKGKSEIILSKNLAAQALEARCLSLIAFEITLSTELSEIFIS